MSPAAAGKGRPPRAGRGSRTPRRSPLKRLGTGRGLRVGEAIYLVAAILLFVLMFFKWYGIEQVKESNLLPFFNLFDQGGNAWQTLEVIPIFLMLAIATAIGAALLRIVGSDWKPAIPPAAAVCVLGGLAALLILIKIVSPPDLGFKGEGIVLETKLELPVFLALAAALGIVYGGWRAMREEGTSFDAIAKKLESPRRPARPNPATGAKSPARKKSAARPKS